MARQGGERRKSLIRLPTLGEERRTIAELEAEYIKECQLHDSLFKGFDPKKWQVEYSHCEHSLKASEMMEACAYASGCNDYEVEASRRVGLLHDFGKLHPTCHVYRVFRPLTPDERIQVDNHAIFSAEGLRHWREVVPQAEKELITDIIPTVRWHHRPGKIKDEVRRARGWRILFVDLLLALMETRWRPGLSLDLALEAVNEIVEVNKDNIFVPEFKNEILFTKSVLMDRSLWTDVTE